ncbi:anthranilate synthase component II [Kineococcus gynurae]|uniref:Anthranilate synthase component II n=1 Tax=Kineococcus gynurae TaxID=452979 RepID=A0ABV5LRM1_9ACTN
MKALLIDGGDPFVHTIRAEVTALGISSVVCPPAAAAERVPAEVPDAVVLGPGPGRPRDAAHLRVLAALTGSVPILGVCLGHQAIGLAFGARIARALRPLQGRSSRIEHDGRGVFVRAPADQLVARYHAFVVDEEGLPPELEVSARSVDDGHVMAMRHRRLPIESVQFHPESIATQGGTSLLASFFDTYC